MSHADRSVIFGHINKLGQIAIRELQEEESPFAQGETAPPLSDNLLAALAGLSLLGQVLCDLNRIADGVEAVAKNQREVIDFHG